jgi:hypothetical protein
MLKLQKKPIVFSGGLDAEFFTEEHAELLHSIKLGEAWFACDYPGAIVNLEKVATLLSDIKPRKKRCYVLIGFDNEKIKQAEKRLIDVWNLGFWPFAMLYRKPTSLKKNNWPHEWLSLQRVWCRPGAFKTVMVNQ